MFDDILCMPNSKDKYDIKDTQTTVKMTQTLRDNIDLAAKDLGISTMEWIRRACQEKLDCAKNPQLTGVDKEAVKGLILEVLEEEELLKKE